MLSLIKQIEFIDLFKTKLNQVCRLVKITTVHKIRTKTSLFEKVSYRIQFEQKRSDTN